jgi:hypothetical protein
MKTVSSLAIMAGALTPASFDCTAFLSLSTFKPRDGWRSHSFLYSLSVAFHFQASRWPAFSLFLVQPFCRFPLSSLAMAGVLTPSCTAFLSLSTFKPRDGWRSHSFLHSLSVVFHFQASRWPAFSLFLAQPFCRFPLSSLAMTGALTFSRRITKNLNCKAY